MTTPTTEQEERLGVEGDEHRNGEFDGDDEDECKFLIFFVRIVFMNNKIGCNADLVVSACDLIIVLFVCLFGNCLFSSRSAPQFQAFYAIIRTSKEEEGLTLGYVYVIVII